MTENKDRRFKTTVGSFIFLSRWLQAPLYFGLIVAQAVYVYRFLLELDDDLASDHPYDVRTVRPFTGMD
jgi:uncharacterized membrane protein YqhA